MRTVCTDSEVKFNTAQSFRSFFLIFPNILPLHILSAAEIETELSSPVTATGQYHRHPDKYV